MRDEGGQPALTRGALEALVVTAERQGLDPMAARLLELRALLGSDLAEVEGALVGLEPVLEGEEAPGAGRLARRAARHLLVQPGKRIRPLCVLLAARAGGVGASAQVRDLAVACELVHAATLLHDDVLDEGTERRGVPTARVLYGNSISILGGDHLLVEALRMVERAGLPGVLTELFGAISEMVAAEALQLERRGRFVPDREVYLRIIRGKTAALFRWGLWAGGRAAMLPERACAAMAEAGVQLGMAFQLVDDALDLSGDPSVTGKNAYADLREGKMTWPFLVGAERDPEIFAGLKALVSAQGEGFDEGAAQALVAGLQRVGALEETRRFAVECGEKARASLSALPAGEAREALEKVVEAAILRSR
jgi:octaprenyl-diphosphate synthase